MNREPRITSSLGRKIRVLIPDGGNVLALPVARCLAAAGNTEVWLMLNRNPSPAWRTRHKAGLLKMGDAPFVNEVLRAVRQTKADVVLAVSEDCILEVARNKAVLEEQVHVAPVPNVRCMDTARDKTELAGFAERAGIPTPRTFIFNPRDRAAFPASAPRFPVLVKPATGTAGRGIKRFDSERDLVRFLDGPHGDARLVVQEFVHGRDVDCSVICRGGRILAYTIQRNVMPGSGSFMAYGGWEFTHDAAVLAVVEKTMAALGFDGAAHCDLRYDEDAGDVKLIEINPRFWGSLAGSCLAGVNFAAIMVNLALGVPVSVAGYRDCRFYSSAVVLKAALRSPRLIWNMPGLLRNSDIVMRLRDPLPELVAICRSLSARRR